MGPRDDVEDVAIPGFIRLELMTSGSTLSDPGSHNNNGVIPAAIAVQKP